MLGRSSAAASVAVCCAVLLAAQVSLDAQTPALAWDEDPAAVISGFAVTVDGVRTDYGMTPEPSSGVCGCSIALPVTSGRHTVVISAYNATGETASPPLVVGPVANAGGPYAGQLGTPLTVTAQGSTDNVGTITSYAWTWGDGTSDGPSSAATASHQYASAGTYTISLTVGDSFSAADSATTSATIVYPPPPGTPTSPAPPSGATGVSATPTLAWTAAGATGYDVMFGTTSPPPQIVSGQTPSSYTPAAALAGGATYFWQIVARNSGGSTIGPVWSFATAASSPPPAANTPFGGTAAAVPGTIQAENFDDGGQGVAYDDTTAGNAGGVYRSTDVDLEATTDAGGGYDVMKTRAGEWLKYTVSVAASGTYPLGIRIANIGTGATFHVEVDGSDATGSLAVPDTGGWQTWTTITTAGIPLTAGQHVLRVAFDTVSSSGGVGNYNWFQFGTASPPPPSLAFGGTPAALPGIVQAENFDTGGSGVSYYDTTAGNKGNVYRSTDVDIGTTADPSDNGYYVGWTRVGEWLNYTVTAAETRSYTLGLRVANFGTGAQVRVLIDGVDATGAVSVPNTGGWDTWQTVSVNVSLTQGPHVVRLVMVTANVENAGVGNYGYLSFQ